MLSRKSESCIVKKYIKIMYGTKPVNTCIFIQEWGAVYTIFEDSKENKLKSSLTKFYVRS